MSTLANELERYLTIRRSLGFQLRTTARVLKRFVAFADDQSAAYVTTDLFLRWRQAFGQANSNTWAARFGMVRQFAQWLNGIDSRHEVPPRSTLHWRYRRTRPHIYSEEEILQILGGATRLQSINGIRALTFSTLFGLIAITGLRISEAVALDDGDVDLVNGVVTVRHGKSGKSRIVPVSRSATDRLTNYAAERNRLRGGLRSLSSYRIPEHVLQTAWFRITSQWFASKSDCGQPSDTTGMAAVRASTTSGTPSLHARCSTGTALAWTRNGRW